jgi:hypothetical protein
MVIRYGSISSSPPQIIFNSNPYVAGGPGQEIKENQMSLFSSIANAEHTFAAWVEKEWTAVYKEAPKVESILAATLKYAGPALQTVVTAEAGGPAGAIVGKVLADAQAGLVAASGLVYDFGATPTVSGVLSTVTTNLSGLLAAGHITNATSVATVNRIVSEINTVAAVVPAIAGAIAPTA